VTYWREEGHIKLMSENLKGRDTFRDVDEDNIDIDLKEGEGQDRVGSLGTR